jgi:hypothetical protein
MIVPQLRHYAPITDMDHVHSDCLCQKLPLPVVQVTDIP